MTEHYAVIHEENILYEDTVNSKIYLFKTADEAIEFCRKNCVSKVDLSKENDGNPLNLTYDLTPEDAFAFQTLNIQKVKFSSKDDTVTLFD